ncbi:hypothetical protein [Acidianus sp. HS-5]|uniref:hypothetical protein n=1 Tax=Acidianus sp. HS-5 TaxID=2886040 RepID=UPI001F29D024|nr:hypothetical protein [Acidianus sp. HS-5]BDC17561.1 hypothetical protein HS5_04510 [Acidianus sp. HS-5]
MSDGKGKGNRLTPAECAVAVSVDILYKAGRPTTPRGIANFLREDVQTVRNTLERLRKKGVVISSLAFGLSGLARMEESFKITGREKIYRLVEDVEVVLRDHQEILDWAKVSLGIKTAEELIEYINKRAEELKREKNEGDNN